MIDALPVWRTTLAALPRVGDNSWAANFAAWYADRIVSIFPDPADLVPTGFVFTFAEAVFAAQLQALSVTSSALTGITNFANAWETALLATTVACAPGTFKPPATPATTFSIVASTVIMPASIAAGKAKILELVSATPVGDALLSEFPPKFRDATLLLRIQVDGTNDDDPTAPLSVPNVKLV